jgi:hypothetical protein
MGQPIMLNGLVAATHIDSHATILYWRIAIAMHHP